MLMRSMRSSTLYSLSARNNFCQSAKCAPLCCYSRFLCASVIQSLLHTYNHPPSTLPILHRARPFVRPAAAAVHSPQAGSKQPSPPPVLSVRPPAIHPPHELVPISPVGHRRGRRRHLVLKKPPLPSSRAQREFK